MRTDCLSLITTAQAGAYSAVAAHRPLARIWGQIAGTLDGSLAALANHERLVWMPAHTTLKTIGELKLSNGQRLSPVDWRANRLVDKLAKDEASRGLAPLAITRALTNGTALVKHAAITLGRVTHAANNHTVVELDSGGKEVKKTFRDSCDAPLWAKRRASDLEKPAHGCKINCLSHNVEKSCIATPAQNSRPHSLNYVLDDVGENGSKRRRTGTHSRDSKSEQQRLLKRRVEELGSSLVAPAGRPSAAERTAALKRRVQAKALASTDA